MKYLSFNMLDIELTRRCNMRPPCPHCLRGDAQDVDLSFEDIDALLQQTEMIGQLTLIGGEPFVVLDRIEYILQRVKELRIPVFKLVVTSNGMSPTEPIIPLLKAWSEYICECNRILMGRDLPGNNFVGLKISFDPYHVHENVAETHMQQYAEALGDAAKVSKSTLGQVPFRKGRAQNLSTAETLPDNKDEKMFEKQIAILDAEHKPVCFDFRRFQMLYERQHIVCCPLYVSALGNVIPDWIGNTRGYEDIDSERAIICKTSEPILDKILEYNRGRMTCFQHAKWAVEHQNLEYKRAYLKKCLTRPFDMLLKENRTPNVNLLYLPPYNADEVNIFLKGTTRQGFDLLDAFQREAAERDYLQPPEPIPKTKAERIREVREQVDADMAAIQAIWDREQKKEIENSNQKKKEDLEK